MEFRSEPVWLDARNALIDLVCMALLVPTPLPLAWWFSFVAYEARMAVTLGSWPRWNSPFVPEASGWALAGGIVLTVLAYSLFGGYAANAPTPWRRLLRAAAGAVVLAGLGIAALYFDLFGTLDRRFH
jgi:hypothetical protein